MMRKKMMAMMTAVGMLAGMAAFPAAAETETEAPPSLWSCKHFLMVDAERGLAVQLLETDVVDNYAAYYDLTGYKITYYGIGMSRIGCGSDQSTWAGKQELEDGDIVTLEGITMIADVYPSCMHFDENSIITNLGQTEEIAERKPLVWLRDTALADAEGNVYYYDDSGFQYLETSIMDQFALGDTIDFWVYGNRAVAPIGASESTVCAPVEFVIADKYEIDGEWNYILMDDNGDTYYMDETAIEEALLSGETFPEYGDVITIQASEILYSEKTGTNWIYANCNSGIPAVIRNTGSILDSSTMESFIVTNAEGFQYRCMENAKGESFIVCIDSYQTEGDILYDAAEGDTVMMYTHNGRPVIAADQTLLPVHEYAVVGVNDGDYVLLKLREYENYYLSAEDAAVLLTEDQEALAYGDILEISGYPSMTENDGIDSIRFCLDKARTQAGGSTSVITSVVEEQAVEKFRYWPEVEDGLCSLMWMETPRRTYYYDYSYTADYQQPGGIDWTAVKNGTSLDMLTYEGVPIVPIYIEEQIMAEYVIVGMDNAEDPQNYAIMNVSNQIPLFPDALLLSAEQVEQYYTGTEPLAFGDVLMLTGELKKSESIHVKGFSFLDEDAGIRKIGSVYDEEVTAEFEIGIRDDVMLRLNQDGFARFTTYIDYAETYEVQGPISWMDVVPGDKVTALTYNGVPVIPVAASRLGDVNADNSLDLLDVLAVSRHLLVGEPLPALSGARDAGLGQCDFDGDGAITQLDALNMLKRVIGLA